MAAYDIRGAAALVPFYKKDDGYYFFMQLRDEGAPTDPGRIGFFGGGIEGEETPLEAVTRETKEELAIDVVPSFFKTYRSPERTAHIFLLDLS
ncbi:MAG: NUDIX domain-containing protein [Patescibacteria group bacterium]